ncbi:MAG TPA: NAD(P)-dependent oxidoreductase [Holophagaceae bacterium]|nr:NAD(P)-dependent oxidoreductase [Holophagaceae bacterium]
MRILLTGATGNAGRALLRHALAEDLGPVFGIHRSALPPEFLTEFATPLADGRVRLIQQDLAELRPDQGPEVDTVIHCAARRGARRCAADPAAAHRDNVQAVQRLMDWARARGPKTFIHCSIHSVYTPGNAPFRESHPTLATDLQVAAKLESEALISEGLGRDVRHLILRLPHFYGAELPSDGVLAAFTRGTRAGELQITGTGEQTVCFMELRDLADLVFTLLEAPPPSGIYNAASETITVARLAERFQRIWQAQGGPPPTLNFTGGPPPPSFGLVCDKLFAVSPWRPRHRLDEWITQALSPLGSGHTDGG